MGEGYKINMQCKNCNNEFEGNFCNNCGQKAETHRLTIKHAFHDFLHSFTHVDKGLLYLIVQLFKRPGGVAKDYIAGKRKSYFNPTQYLLIMVAIATFLTINFHLMGDTLSTVSPEDYKLLSESQVKDLQFIKFIYKYFNLILLLGVPLMALFTWLFFRSSGYNFAEILTVMCFIGGQRTLIFIFLTPLLYFFLSYWYIFIGLYYLLWIIYCGWVYLQVFEGKKSIILIKYIIILIIFLPLTQVMSRMIFNIFVY